VTAAERLAAEAAEVLTAGYVTDLEVYRDLPPYIRTHAESPYTRLDLDRQERRP